MAGSYARYSGLGGGSGGGGITSLSVATANGFAGTVSSGSTPTITLSTTVTGLLYGNGTSLSAQTVGNLTEATSSVLTISGGTGAILGSGLTIQVKQASTSQSGYLSSTDWNTFNNKQATITEGNLTEATSSVLTISGGTSAVIGSGTSIQVNQASGSQSGYLSSTDWTTFNGKQASGSYITALTGDGSASGPGSAALTLATVNTNTGSFGSSTAIPNFTVNGKGLLTAAGSNAVVAPAGTLSGTVLNSTVVTSSLTAVGTIATGVWNGTTIALANGGTGATTAAGARSNLCVAPTVQQFTSGSGTYTTPTSPAPLYIKVTMVGGGGGGAGSGTGSPGSGGNGGTSTFGTSLLSAGGGTGASNGFAGGGAGGSSSLGSGPIGIALTGGGGGGGTSNATSIIYLTGGNGGSSALGGAGGGGGEDGAGGAGVTNSGGGGAGGGITTTTNASSGAGGGSGGYVSAIITSPASTYSYVVGAAGSFGSAGTSGTVGGAGGSGIILVEEFYQ